MKENEEKNSSINQNLKQKNKENKEGLHYKKIQIKHIKKDDKNDDYNPNINLENTKKNKINQNFNKINQNINNNDNHIENENDNFVFEDINNQLDEILENIENDGIEEINKKIKFLNEDKNMFNTISYKDEDIKGKDLNFKKIDNTNQYVYKRNKFPNDKNNNNINSYKHFNHGNKHYMTENRNITNKKYLFTSLNNTYRNWKEENNCNNDDSDDDNYLNKTNISLFYKYNKLYNSKKNEED